MGLETGDYIPDLDVSNPAGTDQRSEGDDHLRLVKKCVSQSFGAFVGTTATPKSVTLTEDQINDAALKSEAQTITGAWQIDNKMTFGPSPSIEHDSNLGGQNGVGTEIELIQCAGNDLLVIGEPSGTNYNGNIYYAGDAFHQFYTGFTEIFQIGPLNAGGASLKDRDAAALKTVGYRCPTRTVVSGTTYSLVQNDEQRVLIFTGSSAVVTLPRNLADDEYGFNCTLINKSGGDITINRTSPATLEVLTGGAVITNTVTLADNSVLEVYNGVVDVWEAWGNGVS